MAILFLQVSFIQQRASTPRTQFIAFIELPWAFLVLNLREKFPPHSTHQTNDFALWVFHDLTKNPPRPKSKFADILRALRRQSKCVWCQEERDHRRELSGSLVDCRFSVRRISTNFDFGRGGFLVRSWKTQSAKSLVWCVLYGGNFSRKLRTRKAQGSSMKAMTWVLGLLARCWINETCQNKIVTTFPYTYISI